MTVSALQVARFISCRELTRAQLVRLFAQWDESKHPRDDHGKWRDKLGAHLEDKHWVDTEGKELSADEQERIRKLRVPPGWKNVRINPDLQAALLAVGEDSKGRDVYLYSAAHAERMAAAKFARLKAFNAVMPRVANASQREMRDTSLPKERRDAAAVTYLIARTGLRVGSERETGGAVQAYGATTLEGRHVSVSGDMTLLRFVGKKGVEIEHGVKDRHLASYLRSAATRGQERIFETTDAVVRDYFKELAGEKFKVKDMRTWQGTATALASMRQIPVPTSKTAFAKARREVAKRVAEHLGNTPTVALSAYIDPAVFAHWEARL